MLEWHNDKQGICIHKDTVRDTSIIILEVTIANPSIDRKMVLYFVCLGVMHNNIIKEIVDYGRSKVIIAPAHKNKQHGYTYRMNSDGVVSQAPKQIIPAWM